ncbi:DUF1405 domain-containing protein [Haloparvum sedimenti]|uniref:DUF1405 domain-containing protein n=1 Tax=Haloparvum sedimenti TaxID=1678448 RepID=UPI00071E8CC0|nr:DUF1405 domain-containing protein [Haloparvum sedimenti]
MTRLAAIRDRLAPLRESAVRRRVRDAFAEVLLGDARSLAAVVGFTAFMFLVGVRYYVATMPGVPTALWPLYADSATAVALATLALVTLFPLLALDRPVTEPPASRPLAYLHTLAFVWLVKYGLWPLVSLNLAVGTYLAAPDALVYYWGVLGTHLLFVGLALLLPAVGRTTRGALALALGLSLANDLLDYGFGYHPPLQYEPGLVLPAATVALSLFATWVASRSFRRLDAASRVR